MGHGKADDRRAVGTGDGCPEEPQQRGSAHGVGEAGPGVPGAEVRRRQHSGLALKGPQVPHFSRAKESLC